MESHIKWKETGLWEFQSIESIVRVLVGDENRPRCQAQPATSKTCGNRLSQKKVSAIRKLLCGLTTLKIPSSELIELLPNLSELSICGAKKHESILDYECQLQYVRTRWIQAIHDACANTCPSRLSTSHQSLVQEKVLKCSPNCEVFDKNSLSQLYCTQMGAGTMNTGQSILDLPTRLKGKETQNVRFEKELLDPEALGNVALLHNNSKEQPEKVLEKVQLRPNLYRSNATSTVAVGKSQVPVEGLDHTPHRDAGLQDVNSLDFSSPDSEISDVFSPSEISPQSAVSTGSSSLTDESVWEFEVQETPSRSSRSKQNNFHHADFGGLAENSNNDSETDLSLTGPSRPLARKLWPINGEPSTLDLGLERDILNKPHRTQTLPIPRRTYENFSNESRLLKRRHSFHNIRVYRGSEDEDLIQTIKNTHIRRRESFSIPEADWQASHGSLSFNDKEHSECLPFKTSTNDETSHDTDPVFKPFRARLAPLDSLLKNMRKSLLKSSSSGAIYCYSREDAEGYVKIGVILSNDEKGSKTLSLRKAVDKRIKKWSHCGYDPKLIFFAEIPYSAMKMETLIFSHLLEHRRYLLCNICLMEKGHDEWFQISQSTAEETVRLWQRFSCLNPYKDHNLFLDMTWDDKVKKKLDNLRATRKKENPHGQGSQELDQWIEDIKTWISQEIPAEFQDLGISHVA